VPGSLVVLKIGRLQRSTEGSSLRYVRILEKAFQRADYKRVQVILPKPVGSEMLPGLGQLVFKMRKRLLKSYKAGPSRQTNRTRLQNRPKFLQRLGATGALWILYLYHRVADVIGYPKAWNASRKGASAASMLVIAEP